MTKRTRLARTISILKRRYTTSLDCALQGGSIALSQRVGRDVRPHYEIREKWVICGSGSKVKAWKIVGERR